MCYDLAVVSLGNSLGYFFSDIFIRRDYSKSIHHMIGMVSCTMALLSTPGIIVYVAKVVGLLETTNITWCVFRQRLEGVDEIPIPKILDLQASGMIFMIHFAVVRFIFLPIFLYTEYIEELSYIYYITLLVPLVVLNIYWMYLLVLGTIKHMKGRRVAGARRR